MKKHNYVRVPARIDGVYVMVGIESLPGKKDVRRVHIDDFSVVLSAPRTLGLKERRDLVEKAAAARRRKRT